MVRTFDFAASFRRVRNAGKRVRSGVLQSDSRVRKGQGLCPLGWPLGCAAMPRSLSRDRLDALLSAAASKRVAVVGDAMLDVYLRGDVERISPEAPVPVVRVRERRHALGGAGNVAQNVRAVGAACDLV